MYGSQVRCLFDEPDYVYTDSTQDTSELYGRGFGFTKVLKRSNVQSALSSPPKVLVISDLARDIRLLASLKSEYPTSKFVMFWGADDPIPDDLKEEVLRISQGVLFCREIY